MVGKLCAAPAKSASAVGLGEYLVGYSVAAKGASREEIAEALDGVYAEAERREDLGVGRVWSPQAGHGTRPSSILVRNCTSFSTAAMEMDADASGNKGVRTAAMHFVWSWNERESAYLTDEQVYAYTGEVLEKLGLAHHRAIMVIHRDTIVYDRNEDGTFRLDEQGQKIVKDGNLHVHAALGSVDPSTGLAYDRTGLFRRMAWAEREVELAHGLQHDHGLAVVQDAGLETAHVRWADRHELAAWRRERQAERLVAQERRSHEAYQKRDLAFSKYADRTVAPRLKTAIDLARERGRKPDWATMHAVAARYGCEIQVDDGGHAILRDVGVWELQLEHQEQREVERERLEAEHTDHDGIDLRMRELDAEHRKEEAAGREGKQTTGDWIRLDMVLQDSMRDMPIYQSVDDAERSIIERVERQPSLVLDDITAQSSTFAREDVDLWLASRILDPDEIERLGDMVVREPSVRVLEADTPMDLLTTTNVLAVEDRLEQDARVLASRESGISTKQVERAIRTYEKNKAKEMGKPFHLSNEQKEVVRSITRGGIVSCDGLSGTGKTTVMGAINVLAKQIHRDVVGLTLSQAAAERLEHEAGFASTNTAMARTLEGTGRQVIPQNGIVVIDENSMVDSRSQARILELARQRNCVVVEIGDQRQLQPIDFGASARIIERVTREHGTRTAMREIQRQRLDWHKEAVRTMADAIVERDESKRLAMVTDALRLLDSHGAIRWTDNRDQAIDAAVASVRANRAMGYRDAILIGPDKDTVRHLSEQDRALSGLAGKGTTYLTEGGGREFAVGDRLMFLENSLGKRGLGVRNGDHGAVVRASANRIAVRMDAVDGRKGRVVEFDPGVYRAFDYGNASTVHKAQGASVSAATAVIDRSASAELFFVAASRSKQAVDLVVSHAAFENLDALAAHISDRISLKTTTRTYDELLERTGGRDTIRVQNMEAQRVAEPLRRVWDAEVVAPIRALREKQVADLRQAFRDRKREVAKNSALSMEQRLEAEREELKRLRKASATVYRDVQPTPFSTWLRERQEARARARGVERAREARRELETAQEAERTHTHEQQHEHRRGRERGHEHDRGYEWGR